MTTKHLVLEILEQNRGQSISGEYIAERLNLSRNMIWRAIKDLRNDGYVIEAATNKGYRLTGENDILSAEGIMPFLLSPDFAENIKVFESIDSTNREAKAGAIAGARHGTVILANQQTSGRGRRDREFFSPSDCGLYMSLILSADALGFANPTAITAYAALCVCEAIEAVCGLTPKIKWVNDIFLCGKKIGGILTEAITELESGSVREIIVGIGINVSTRSEDFPEMLKDIAGSLYPDSNSPITRNRLAGEIINRILCADRPNERALFEKYKQRLFMLGADITVIEDREKYTARALDINEKGHLIVRTQNGEIRTLSSGEVRVL